jgi:hypothetical protein
MRDTHPPSDLRQWSVSASLGSTSPRGVGIQGGRDWLWLSCLLSSSAWTRSGLCWQGLMWSRSPQGWGCIGRRCMARYLSEQLAGLADRSHRPHACPRQVADAVEVAVVEMRREHPRWGSRRIRLEMLRKPGPWASGDLVVPSERTIDRLLHRKGLLRARPRKRPRDSYVRFERPGPMQLWQMDIVEESGWSTRSPVSCARRRSSPRSMITPGSV